MPIIPFIIGVAVGIAVAAAVTLTKKPMLYQTPLLLLLKSSL